MDYSKMSDFEINWKVAFHIGLRTVEKAESGDFNPCNNVSDAWPIIVSNKISLYAFKEEAADRRGAWGAEGCEITSPFHFNDNPLRAAMTVFLMMQDARNEK
ncbi:phage protein NinX family protein [Klebsiella quasipneumoniae subsp. similipneumoniae]|uniref:phage protein NinX family protein n=1 Tax=Klebsiella quasipneumoniae TaxID=1463165 RepID=UPI0035A8778A